MKSKTCTRCGKTKRLSEFVADKNKRDGHRAYCHECDRNQQRAARRRQKPAEPVAIPAPPPHTHVYIRYQEGVEPKCFTCFFWEQRQRREHKVNLSTPQDGASSSYYTGSAGD